MELRTLFEQLDEQVVLQDTAVVDIEQTAGTVHKDVEGGNVQLDKGIVHSKRARKLKWWCLFIVVLIILILALVLGLFFGLKKH